MVVVEDILKRNQKRKKPSVFVCLILNDKEKNVSVGVVVMVQWTHNSTEMAVVLSSQVEPLQKLMKKVPYLTFDPKYDHRSLFCLIARYLLYFFTFLPSFPVITAYLGATYVPVPNQLCGTFCGSRPAAASPSCKRRLWR